MPDIRKQMAEMEAWDTALEMQISESDLLTDDKTIQDMSDDLYIALFSRIFDSISSYGDQADAKQKRDLFDLAKTLMIYSNSDASNRLTGVNKKMTNLYCAAALYLSDFPASASLLAKKYPDEEALGEETSDEERFLQLFLSREFNENSIYSEKFKPYMNSGDKDIIDNLINDLELKEKEGLEKSPRLFITARLLLKCLKRFKKFNIAKIIKENSSAYDMSKWIFLYESLGEKGFWEFFPSQIEAIKSKILEDDDTAYSLQMPTSSGKTSLCEILIYNEVKIKNRKVLFLVPYRALAAEIKESISKPLKKLGIEVFASYGGNIPTQSEIANSDNVDVLITTPEKFSAICYSVPEMDERFRTIICDEGHLIDDDTRGFQYEMLLTKLKSSEHKKKIIFISAILPNMEEINNWLGGTARTLAKSDYKPVNIDFAFVEEIDDDTYQLNFNTIDGPPKSFQIPNFIKLEDLRAANRKGRENYLTKRDSNHTLCCITALKAKKSAPVAVFVATKKGCGEVAKRMLKLLDEYEILNKYRIDNIDKNNENLIEYIKFQLGDNYDLGNLLKYKIAYHHGSFPQDIRREIEIAMQDRKIDVLICTSTLAEGVNLPIRTLIVHSITRWISKKYPNEKIKKRNLKNIFGRVGRASKETKGRIIFPHSISSNFEKKSYIEEIFNDSKIELARGRLYNIIVSINKFAVKNERELDNNLFEEVKDVVFLNFIDQIDKVLISLMPENTSEEYESDYVKELIEDTLAYQLSEDSLKKTMRKIFSLRVECIKKEIPQDSWGVVKKTGCTPRYWKFANSNNLLNSDLWTTLDLINNKRWMEEIIFPITKQPELEILETNEILSLIISNWMNGKTYSEIYDEVCSTYKDIYDDVYGIMDKFLESFHDLIDYKLPTSLNLLTQLSIEKHGEGNLSEYAKEWASLLQYGLGNLQQLDIFTKCGITDRLGAWSLSRYLEEQRYDGRGRDIKYFLKNNSKEVIAFLDNDKRVPKLSVNRVIDELKLNR